MKRKAGDDEAVEVPEKRSKTDEKVVEAVESTKEEEVVA